MAVRWVTLASADTAAGPKRRPPGSSIEDRGAQGAAQESAARQQLAR
jgi:hypothetical protein